VGPSHFSPLLPDGIPISSHPFAWRSGGAARPRRHLPQRHPRAQTAIPSASNRKQPTRNRPRREESSASNPRRAARRRREFMDGGDFDLNSQAPLLEEFPGLGLYGSLLQNDDDQVGSSRGPGLPLYRPPRIGAAPMAPLLARQLNFGGSM
jgi:hypothetical protein